MPNAPETIESAMFDDLRRQNYSLDKNLICKQIIDNARDGIIVYGPDMRYQVWNPFMESFSGKSAAETLGRHPQEIFPFLKEGGVIAAIERVISEAVPAKIEYQYRLPEIGKTGWVSNTLTPLLDANGEVSGVIGIVRDITESKLAEEALTRSEEKYRALIETTDTGYLILDEQGRVVDANAEYVRLTGRKSLKEIVGHHVTEWTAPYDLERNAREVDKCALRGHVWGLEIDYIDAAGKATPIEINAKIIETENGNRILSVCRDITERRLAKKKEKELQAQLLQSQKMEAIGQLAGGLAHDFNNMLGVILSASELAGFEIDDDSPARDDLKAINEAVKRAREVTMKLLTFARKDKISFKGIEAEKLLGDLYGMLIRTTPKSIDVKIDVKDNCVIKCDANQIQQALLNVCNNAVDAMPYDGTLTIEVEEAALTDRACDECGMKMKETKYCVIRVSDTGAGVPKEILSRITEPFFTTKGSGNRTGLGLSVTQGIILSHNGHLHIYGEPGGGTCVKILLPIVENAAAHVDEIAEKKPLRGDETILVVDDEEVLLQMAGRLLTKYGYKPLLANNGNKAVELYREHKGNISVVVLDLMMPGMSGGEVNKKLKALNPKVKVLFASGFSQSGVAEFLLKENSRRFVQKPFDIDCLCRAIRELIDER